LPGTAGGELLLDSVTVYPMSGSGLATAGNGQGHPVPGDIGLN